MGKGGNGGNKMSGVEYEGAGGDGEKADGRGGNT